MKKLKAIITDIFDDGTTKIEGNLHNRIWDVHSIAWNVFDEEPSYIVLHTPYELDKETMEFMFRYEGGVFRHNNTTNKNRTFTCKILNND